MFNESTWIKSTGADAYRRHQFQTSKYSAVKLPDTYDEGFGYHTSCYQKFTAITQSSVPQDEVSSKKIHVLRSDTTHETWTSSGIFSTLCLFCGHVKKSKGRYGKEHRSNCETEDAAASILVYNADVSIDDVKMLARISGVDMIANEVKYHHSCKRLYLHKAERENSSADQSQREESDHDRAFQVLRDHVTDTLIDTEGAELLTSLHEKYLSELGYDSSYTANTLREKIMKTFPQLRQCKQSNRQGIVIYNPTLSEEATIKRANFDHNSIIKCTFYLRCLIKDAEWNLSDLPETLSVDILAKGQAKPPEDLVKFFHVLYTVSSGQLILPYCIYVFSIIIYLIKWFPVFLCQIKHNLPYTWEHGKHIHLFLLFFHRCRHQWQSVLIGFCWEFWCAFCNKSGSHQTGKTSHHGPGHEEPFWFQESHRYLNSYGP